MPTPALNAPQPICWFDAHLDLACLAVNGRDLLAPLDPAAGPEPPAAVTLPALAKGNVRFALATIFTEPGGAGPEGYPVGDAERAFRVGRAQLEVYLTWQDRGAIALDLKHVLAADTDTGDIRGGMGVAEVVPPSLERRIARLPRTPALHAGILIENADIIRAPEDLSWWVERGVVAVGMAWAKSSRYAGGNNSQDALSDLGRGLVREMDRLGIVHDASHLSDRAFAELFETAQGRIIASHSNSRALLGDPAQQRHLTDQQIRAIVMRGRERERGSAPNRKNGGMIGLNLYSRFLRPGYQPGDRATIEQTLAHIEHICDLAGDRKHIGLGSDMDGGFSAACLPEGINEPDHLQRLADALSRRNWSDGDIDAFAWENWCEFWGESLPQMGHR